MEGTGRQRQLLQSAESLATEIRSIPLHSPGASTFTKLIELSRITRRFFESTDALPNAEAKQMWLQRGTWLKEEVAGLVQERIYSSDEQTQWMNLVELMFAGAEAYDMALRGKAEAELSCQAANEQITQLQATVAELTQKLSSGVPLPLTNLSPASGPSGTASSSSLPSPQSSDEIIALRSRTRVLQEEVLRLQSESHAQSQQLSSLSIERDALRTRVAQLQDESQSLMDLAEERLVVINSLMLAQEAGSRTAAEHQRLQQHCKTLSSNLEANALVIEKLIGLNTELMDGANLATWSRLNGNKNPAEVMTATPIEKHGQGAEKPHAVPLSSSSSAAVQDPTPSLAAAFASFLSGPNTSLDTPPPPSSSHLK
jgi:myosin heavy subunit